MAGFSGVFVMKSSDDESWIVGWVGFHRCVLLHADRQKGNAY